MSDTAPAPTPPKPTAPKKPAKTARKPAKPSKPKTPFDLIQEEIRREMAELDARREEARVVARAAEMCRGPFRRRPEWMDYFAKSLSLPARPNPVPDGGSLKVAREQVVNEILERIEAAIAAGVLQLVRDPNTGREVVVIADGLYALMHQLSPKDYPLALKEPTPTASAPGSPERVEEYRRRAEQVDPETGEPLAELHAAGDANDLTGAVLAARLNGVGMRVLGRADGPPPAPAPGEGSR